MTNLTIPEELTPLTTFNWSQFSDTLCARRRYQSAPEL